MKNDEIRLATFLHHAVFGQTPGHYCMHLAVNLCCLRDSPERTGRSATHAVLLLSNAVPVSFEAATKCLEQMLAC